MLDLITVFLIIELLVLLTCIKEPPKIYYYIRKTHLSLGSLTMIITMSELLKIKVEIAANVIPVRTDDLEWSIGGNVTFQDSKITKLTTTLPNTQV
jgi:bacteriorhodopsin